MRIHAPFLALALLLAAPLPEAGRAAAPEVSPVPSERPARSPAEAPAERPASRPAGEREAAARGAATIRPGPGLSASLRPGPRPEGLVLAMARRPRDTSAGGLCGQPTLAGTRIPAIRGQGGCGIAEPVRVTHVRGLALSSPARMDCPTARALDAWVAGGVIPVVGRAGGGAVGLFVAGDYVCRPRNNQSGARLSEHGTGRAIDISGIRLANGNVLSVLSGWRSSSQGPLLREMHRRACGIFGTVLGPDADRHHQDHFHFDTARYRSGSYCR